jgi:outer membrane protein TolC
MTKYWIRPILTALWPALVLAQTAPGQPAESRPVLELSLKQAVEIALAPEGNTRVQLAQELIRQAQTRSAQARAALLPSIESSMAQQNQTRNLAAFGIQISLPLPGFQFPERVGPFSTFDLRATASQSIFDLGSIRRFQASRAGLQAAQAESDSARDQVAGQVAKLYLAVLVTEAKLDAARANLELAEALVKLAINQKSAGTGTGIDVTRAKVQAANQRQRLVVATNERRQAHLQLLKAMGLKLDTEVQLTDSLAYAPVDSVTLEEAKGIALKSRADLKAQHSREENARLGYSATRLERVPSLVAFGDYGTIGTGIDHALPTRTYGVLLRVPLFDGGRRDARRNESFSQLRQERVKTNDLRAQIELEIRLALDALRSAEEQVKVAEEGLQLAQDEVAQAQRRYQAGVTSSLEVTDAQTRLERARENRIAALFGYNAARIDLGQAMGAVRRMIQ